MEKERKGKSAGKNSEAEKGYNNMIE